jgi:hypothetical protein
MTEAAFGLAGVIVGAFLAWFQAAWSDRRTRERHARYLAIRVVCVLDRYLESCAEVAIDDGLCEGQPNAEGFLEPQVSLPPPPAFSDDMDWKSIPHELMYRLLSLPSEAEVANRMIAGAAEHDTPPDYASFFEERQYQYAKLGLRAFKLTDEIRKAYAIPGRECGEWNPVEHLAKVKTNVEQDRLKRASHYANSPFLTG